MEDREGVRERGGGKEGESECSRLKTKDVRQTNRHADIHNTNKNAYTSMQSIAV